MEPTIGDRDVCIFRHPPPAVTAMLGKPVLVEHRSGIDIENGGAYTVKRLRRVRGAPMLVPDNDEFPSLQFDEERMRIVAILVVVVGPAEIL